jgi:hypothetical protein
MTRKTYPSDVKDVEWGIIRVDQGFSGENFARVIQQLCNEDS